MSFTDLLRHEFINIPLAHWGFFFPCHVAAWRYIGETYPGLLGELNAGYDDEPWFAGQGAKWFCADMINDEAYINAVEAIMYALVAQIPESAKTRGFVLEGELPELNSDVVEQIEKAIISKVTSAS